MKKLLSLLTALTFTSFSTLGVVACSHNSQLQKTDISKKIPNSINLEKLDTNTTTDFLTKLIIQLNKVSELKNIATTDFDIYKAGTTTSIQDSDIFPNSSLKIKIVVKKSSTKFSGSKDNIVVIYKNEQQDTIYIDKDGKQQITNTQDLSDLNITEVTQIGYYTNDEGEIQAVTMPTTILKVPNQLPPQITSTSHMFVNALKFNQDISSWNTSNITNMQDMFYFAASFNQKLNSWNTSNVTNMEEMFSYAESFNSDISNWNTSNVTTMKHMFNLALKFNQNVSKWNTSNVTNMEGMFYSAEVFNGNISNWNTSNVTTMKDMFNGSSQFNQDLLTQDKFWNTSNVTNMEGMFNGASVFDGNISNWNTSHVTTMEGMFCDASAFNKNISKKEILNLWVWDTSNVTNMITMFNGAKTFNIDISNWSVDKVEKHGGFAEKAGFDNKNKLPKFKNFN